jgi:uncharacterized protein with HEPN domain
LPEKEKLIRGKKDLKTKRFVEILGKFVNRIEGLDPHSEISNSCIIIATRNQIIHGYDSASEETIWPIMVNKLPEPKDRQIGHES